MPGFDGTGPWGLGPRTGGGRGFCPPGSGPAGGYYRPGFYGVGRGGLPWGGGRGRTWGGGRGWWWRSRFAVPAGGWYPPFHGAWNPSPQEEAEVLREDIRFLEERLAQMQQRLSELEKASEGEEE